jgi:tetratricopeptide (TPR) repeat protein
MDRYRWDEALAASQEATDIYRKLAQIHAAAYESKFAASLLNLGIKLCGLGRFDEALVASQSAIDIYRQLAMADRAANLANLAMSLRAYAWICARAKIQLPAALKAATEAIHFYTELVDRLPQAHVDQLLWAYQTLADVFEGLGRKKEADDVRQELAEGWGHASS